jgi:hypothetical protein
MTYRIRELHAPVRKEFGVCTYPEMLVEHGLADSEVVAEFRNGEEGQNARRDAETAWNESYCEGVVYDNGTLKGYVLESNEEYEESVEGEFEIINVSHFLAGITEKS